ncbi:MAG TPA: hypothetical protein VNN06_17000, partial [Ramlibacter sp.]|nr:hypothetical protein [Ramlibacter sp.]
SYRSPWVGMANFQEIEIAELSAAHTDALVRELISRRREFQDIAQLIVRRSGGNPFFAEELVRSLAERGVLSGDPADGRNSIESVERALPATVQALIGARIDHLGESDKSLLQMCAIVGKEIPLAVLERVAEPMHGPIGQALDALCRAELIQPQPASGVTSFAFRHPLIQEVAYSTQLKARRATLHASVAGVMEQHYARQLDEYAALISHHFEAAGRALDAAEYSGRAAQWLSLTDPAQAITHWRKARALVGGQAGDARSDRLRAMACSQISLLGWREGLSLADVQPLLDEAMGLASKVDSRLTQLLLMIEGRMLQASGGPADRYVEKAQQALSLVKPGTDVGRTATIHAVLCQAYGWAGLLRQALEANDTALANLAAIDKFDRDFIGFSTEQWVLGMRCRLLTRLGRFDEARACLLDMIEAGKESTDPLFLQMVHYAHIELAWCLQDPALAEEHALPIDQLAEKYPIPYSRVFALHGRGSATALAGDMRTAAHTFSEALALVRSDKVAMELEPEILVSLADSRRATGDTDEALRLAREAIELSRQRSARLPECRALITFAAALADRYGPGQRDACVAALLEAERLLETTGANAYQRLLQREKQRVQPAVPGSAAVLTKRVNSRKP